MTLEPCKHRTVVSETMVKCAHWRVRAPGDLTILRTCTEFCTWKNEPNKPKPDYPFPPPRTCGPGCRLLRLTDKMGISHGGCGCESHAAEMDRWGAKLCREHVDYTLEVMRRNASKLGVPFSESIARWLINLAITLSEEDREMSLSESAKLLALRAGLGLVS